MRNVSCQQTHARAHTGIRHRQELLHTGLRQAEAFRDSGENILRKRLADRLTRNETDKSNLKTEQEETKHQELRP